MTLRIIDLDIDEALSADTRVSEVGWVLQPAIETEFVYFSKDRMDKKSLKKIQDYLLEYQPNSLPPYVNYATGDTKDDMLIKPIFNRGQRVSFDYDNTLTTARGYGLALHEKFLGSQLYIVSARNDKRSMLRVADKLGVPHNRVFATGSDRNKIQKIKDLNIMKHYDDNKEVISQLGRRGIQFNCPCLDEISDTGQEIFNIMEQYNLVGIIDGQPVFSTPDQAEDYGELLGCNGHHTHTDENGNEVYMACDVHPEKFATYNDYPKQASANACKVLKWIDEYGRDEVDGMTTTGLARANQLCSRENISEETIARMAAFERHRKNSTIAPEYKGTPWKDKGYVAWLGWGGDAGVEWASRKLEQIRKEDFAKVGERGGIKASPKAPKSDTPNKNPKGEGSAKGDASGKRGAKVSEAQEKTLQNKVDEFNEKDSNTKNGRATLGALKSVFQRGLGAFNTSHSPKVKSAEQWAYARVNAFLYLLKNGRPENAKYTTDYDLLPKGHPKKGSSEKLSVVECECGHSWDDSDGYVCHKCGRDNENITYGFGIDEYSPEELETIKLLKFLADTDYEKFEAVVGSMRGATEQEIYKRNHNTPTIYFQYERVLSGSPDRDFCTSIENRYFRRLEIDLLRDMNTEFGHKQQPYSKWLYKGGPNCVHAWHKYLFQGKNKTDQGMGEGKAGIPPKSMSNNGYFSPETKRKSEVAYIVSQQNMSKQIFKADNDQRMIYTPLMIPNILIPRNDDGDIYFVRFRPEVIKKIRDKFMIEGRLRQNNYEHSDQKFNDIAMVESWIVEGSNDKAYQLGFTEKQAPIGSWMATYKVLETEEGDVIWNDYIKSGKVKGVSVEGEFLLKFFKQDFSKEEIILDEVMKILNQVEL